MYTLRLTNTTTDEVMEHYYDTIDPVVTLFENELNALLLVDAKFKLEVLDDVFGCLAYADGELNEGGLLWEHEEEYEDAETVDESWWDWSIAKFWDENEEKRDDWCEDDGWVSNCPCDTYGMCGGPSCPNYWKCNG